MRGANTRAEVSAGGGLRDAEVGELDFDRVEGGQKHVLLAALASYVACAGGANRRLQIPVANVQAVKDREAAEQLPRNSAGVPGLSGGLLDVRREVPVREILHREEQRAARILEPAEQRHEQVLVLRGVSE